MQRALPDTWDSEGALQGAVARYLDAVLDPAHARWTHIPSGGHRNKITAANLKRQGVKPGWPDCIILFMGRVLFIELKRTKNARVSPMQTEFAAFANLNGFPTVVCRSLGGVEKALKEYGVPTRMARVDFDPHAPIEDLGAHFAHVHKLKIASP